MTANEVQRRLWNHPDTVSGWEKRERLTERVSRHVLVAAQVQSGERVLEIGSGGGKLALLAAKQVGPGGRVFGADISGGMVELATARAKAARARNVSFSVADCQSDALEGAPFDLAISQFGVMFFDEPVHAFSNIRKHLRKGARLVFACWQPSDKNSWFPGAVLAQFSQGSSDGHLDSKPAPGPFAFQDPGYVRGILQDAGFMGIDRVAKIVTVRASLDSVIDAPLIERLGLDDTRHDELEAALDRHYEPMRLPDSNLYRFELRIQLFAANALP